MVGTTELSAFVNPRLVLFLGHRDFITNTTTNGRWKEWSNGTEISIRLGKEWWKRSKNLLYIVKYSKRRSDYRFKYDFTSNWESQGSYNIP